MNETVPWTRGETSSAARYNANTLIVTLIAGTVESGLWRAEVRKEGALAYRSTFGSREMAETNAARIAGWRPTLPPTEPPPHKA